MYIIVHVSKYNPSVVINCQSDLNNEGFSNSETIFFQLEISVADGLSSCFAWDDEIEALGRFCDFEVDKCLLRTD